jgi:hypothetical protein
MSGIFALQNAGVLLGHYRLVSDLPGAECVTSTPDVGPKCEIAPDPGHKRPYSSQFHHLKNQKQIRND